MRVLYASQGYSVHDLRFLSAYADAGFEVAHLQMDPARVFEQRPLPEGVVRVELPKGHDPGSLDRLIAAFRHAARTFRPDVTHAGPIPDVAWAASAADVRPMIAMSWGSDMLLDVNRSQELSDRARAALAHAAALQCDCEAVERVAVDRYGFDPARIVRFPWGIDLQRFSPGSPDPVVREQLGGADDVVVLSNRTWEHVYGVDTAIRAFAEARETEPRLKLALAGSGKLAPMIERTIADHGIAESVVMLGRVPNEELVGLLRACDVYLACSHSDGTSISLLEAMACALPCVVSDIPGNREWIEPGLGGALAPVADEHAFAAALASIAQAAPERRSEMGRHNRDVAETRADWPRNVPALIETARRLGESTR